MYVHTHTEHLGLPGSMCTAGNQTHIASAVKKLASLEGTGKTKEHTHRADLL